MEHVFSLVERSGKAQCLPISKQQKKPTCIARGLGAGFISRDGY